MKVLEDKITQSQAWGIVQLLGDLQGVSVLVVGSVELAMAAREYGAKVICLGGDPVEALGFECYCFDPSRARLDWVSEENKPFDISIIGPEYSHQPSLVDHIHNTFTRRSGQTLIVLPLYFPIDALGYQETPYKLLEHHPERDIAIFTK